MTSSNRQDGRWPPAAFVGHELGFSELNRVLAAVAQSPLARREREGRDALLEVRS